ncbi:hypothetical protein [Winogradskyella helgolandensis]|uniref:hypothetical protein n=1 Tax=Winogradskyella helgolandensis TaxID=2697010 RepID=UPI0015BB6977|nr:hypothetical protein [Winogradskyella helgolandensis]
MKTQKHMTRSNTLLITLLISFIVVTGCGGSDDDGNFNNTDCNDWSEHYLAQANAYSAASNAYATDPTLANCQNYKSAGLNFIDALEDVIDCVPNANREGFLADIEQYRDDINTTDCN